MDEANSSISPLDSDGRIGADAASIAADVSRPADAGDTVVVCPLSPIAAPADFLSEGSMIVYCGDARELEEGFCIALRAMGAAADFLPADIVPSAVRSTRENN
jgi:hypothetical protein